MRWAIVFFAVVTVLAACSLGDDDEKAATSGAVLYEVTGTACRVNTTYENAGGGTSQESNRPLPWQYGFNAGAGTFVYISAQNQCDTGTVIATIYHRGVVFKQSVSDGAYVIATASGILE